MATKKITQSTIKRLINEGAAVDLTELYRKGKAPKKSELERIGTSYGIYGVNGALFIRNGKLYGISSRNSALNYYV